MAKKSGLGRGLDSLFTSNELSEHERDVTKLRLSDVEPKSDQPRTVFDEASLTALSESIKENGLIQPIAVRRIAGDRYQIIAGERRWRASKIAGLTEISAVILDADDLQTAQLALIENIQRENLNPIEEAKAYKALMETFGLTQENVADRVGKSRSAIANTLRLLDLPDEISKYLADGTLSQGHCKALLALKNKSVLSGAVSFILLKDLSVRQTEAYIKTLNSEEKKPADDNNKVTINYVAELEKKVQGISGRYCKITTKGKRKTVSFEYTDEGDLEELLSIVCKKNILED